MRPHSSGKRRWRSLCGKTDAAASQRTARHCKPSVRAASSSSSAGRIARNRPRSIIWMRSSPAMLSVPLVLHPRQGGELGPELAHPAAVEEVVFKSVEEDQLPERASQLVRSAGERQPTQGEAPLTKASSLLGTFRPMLLA